MFRRGQHVGKHMWRETGILEGQAQSNMAGESDVSYGMVGDEVSESAKREQALNAILDLDIYPL